MSKLIREPSALSVYRPGLFNGKVAIVTGGGTGIGKSIAHELALLGATVVIAARTSECCGGCDPLRAWKRESPRFDLHDRVRYSQRGTGAGCGSTVRIVGILRVRGAGEELILFCVYIADKQVNNLVDETLAKFKRIDFLINNAGGQFRSLAADIKLKGWEAVMRTNLTGTFLVTKKAYHAYMKEHGGNIVNIILVMENGYPMMSHSAAARAGIQNLTKSLAVEWASSGITINCVAPGIILSSGADNYEGGASVFITAAEKLTTAKRVGSVEEVSAGVLFYLTPAAQYTTGTTLHVDGGWHLLGPIIDVPPHKSNKAYGSCKL